MEALFGIAGEEFVVLGSDKSFRNNVVVAKADYTRCTRVNNQISIIAAGNQGDASRAVQYAVEVLRMEESANGMRATENTLASVLQQHIHKRLRRDPLEVTSIVGGVSEGKGQVVYIDQYGAVCPAKYIGTGYAAYMFHSTMDMKYHPGITEDEAVKILSDVYSGLKRRMVVNYDKLHVCIINQRGTREIEV